METTWTFEVTRDQVARLELELEWALQRQNARFSNAMPTQRMSVNARRVLVIGLSLAIGFLSFFGMRDRDGHLGTWATVGIVFAAFTTVMGVFLPQVRRWSKRTAGAMLTRRARRILRPVLRRAPYAIEYKLGADELVADIPALRMHRVLALGEPKRVLATPNLVVAFRRQHSQNPMRIIYVSDQRDALLAAFRERLVVCELINGPVDGYVAPVPEARLT